MPVQQVFMLAAGITLCVMALYLAGLSPLIRKRRRIQSPRQRRQTGRDDQHEDEHATCYIVKGRGLVVISSCGHTGIINTVRSAMIA